MLQHSTNSGGNAATLPIASMQSQSKSQQVIADIDKLILNFIYKDEKSRIASTILKEKNKVGGLTLSDFKTYYKATIIKIVWYRWKYRQIDEYNTIESPETDPYKYSRLTFDKGARATQRRKAVYSLVVLEQLDVHMQQCESRHRPYTCSWLVQNGSQIKMENRKL